MIYSFQSKFGVFDDVVCYGKSFKGTVYRLYTKGTVAGSVRQPDAEICCASIGMTSK